MDQATTTTADQAALPKLGEDFHGGKYAGVTTDKTGAVYALILLGDKPEPTELTFQAATAWAEGLGEGASLPSRVESLLLFSNLKGEFAESWHWTNEPYSERSAWSQDFDCGYQDYDGHYYELCARSVRRLPINPSVL